jgi:hypothetical protein
MWCMFVLGFVFIVRGVVKAAGRLKAALCCLPK